MATQSNDYTYASAQAASIAASVGLLQLQDRGHSYWRRVSSPPTHPGKFRSQDRFLPDGSTDNTNGGYWEFQAVDGIIDVEEWGLAGDGTTNNSQNMTDLLAFIRAKQVNPTDAVNAGGYRIRFPIGHFYFGSGIELKDTIIIEGQGTGMAGGIPTKLRFATGGIVVNIYDTINGGIESPATIGGGGTIIRNLLLTSSATSGNYDGIWLRGRATIEHVSVESFPRHGIRIEAEGLGTAAPVRGNANNWRVLHSRLTGNGDCGLFVSGGDTNAGMGMGIDSSNNGNWGIFDASFLGNVYLGCHADYNGSPGIPGRPDVPPSPGRTAPSVVTYNGKYYAVVPGQDSAASTTTPGTNAWVWFEFWLPGDGPAVGSAPWSSATSYKSGGAYALISDAGTGNLLLGCYSEGSQGPSFLGVKAMSVNGTHGAGIGGHGCATRGSDGLFESRLGFATATDKAGGSVSLGGNLGNGDILRIGHSAFAPSSNRLMWKGDGDLSFNYQTGVDKEPFFVTGAATTTQFGTGVSQPHVFALDKLALGAGYIGEGGGRRITYRSAAPSAGSWARGDFAFNLNPSTAAPFGWRCTASGAPGTWEAVVLGGSGSSNPWTIDYTSNRASYYNLTPASGTHIVFNTSSDGYHALFLQNTANGSRVKLSRVRGGQSVAINTAETGVTLSRVTMGSGNATIADGGTVLLTKVANNLWIGEGDFTN